jgi:hypothetical protein
VIVRAVDSQCEVALVTFGSVLVNSTFQDTDELAVTK